MLIYQVMEAKNLENVRMDEIKDKQAGQMQIR